MLGGFGYSNAEQKHPSQATFKAQLNKQTNKHSETRKTNQSFNKPHSFDHRGWENGISSILPWLNLPSELGVARMHLSSRTFLVFESNNQTWVMPSRHKSILNWGMYFRKQLSKQLIERVLLWQLLDSLAVAPCIRAGKREKKAGSPGMVGLGSSCHRKPMLMWLHSPSAQGWWMGSLTWMARVKREPTAPWGVGLEGPCQEIH